MTVPEKSNKLKLDPEEKIRIIEYKKCWPCHLHK